MSERINYRYYRKISLILMMVTVILLLSPKLLSLWIDSQLLNNRILPVVWCFFIFIIIRFIPRVHPIGRISMLENLYLEAIVCAAVLTGMQFFAGSVIGELGESPYIMTPTGILNNLFFVFPPLIGRELTRSYILGAFCNKTNVKVFILVTAVMTLASVNVTELKVIKNMQDLTIYLAENFGPILSQNILLSYLALYGGIIASLSFISIITLFHWTSPILPVLNWLAKGSIGILVPIFFMMVIIRKYENRVNHVRKQEISRLEAFKWIVTSVFSIGLIWFVIGVFPVVPSVVATGSMIPVIYPGDLVLLEKTTSEDQVLNLKTGDIIQFQRDGIRITHRIVKIEEDDSGQLKFCTKGDNNSTADVQLVDPNDVKGIYIETIPKLGYPTLLLKGRFSGTPDDTVF